jgi:Arc/MetJ-type ribon-helix-helix transcriptional regulator
MPNPKKNHVRYVRRIPLEFVDKMDAHLSALRKAPDHSDAVKKALAMTDESSKRMATYSRQMRQDLEGQARAIISTKPPATHQPIPAKDYSVNFLKNK